MAAAATTTPIASAASAATAATTSSNAATATAVNSNVGSRSGGFIEARCERFRGEDVAGHPHHLGRQVSVLHTCHACGVCTKDGGDCS